MSLDSYDNLKTELADWALRADITATVDTMIDLFEAWANRNLRHREMEAEATTTATEYVAFPSDFLQLRDIQYQGSPRRQLLYATPQQADDIDPTGTTGLPTYYSIVGNQFRLIPAPSESADIRISYWQKIPALNTGEPTNWLLESHPDAYLYGSLAHGLIWAHNPMMAQHIASAWTTMMSDLQSDGKKSNLGGPLVTRCG